jgi:hypothetical protein
MISVVPSPSLQVIGKTSPVAYNVLGHFKLVCILVSGFLFFHEDATPMKVAGTLVTFSGVLIYTHLQQTLKSGWESRAKEAPTKEEQYALVGQSPGAEEVELEAGSRGPLIDSPTVPAGSPK